jgi:hypothetical protein
MSDHEHRAYEVWDGDSRWASASLEQTVKDLEYRLQCLEETVWALQQEARR